MTTSSATSHVRAAPGGRGRLRSAQVVCRRLLSQRQAVAGLVTVCLVLAVALVGPVVAPHDPNVFVGPPFGSPNSQAWLGTDFLGRDVFSRVLWGGRTVLAMSLAAAALGLFVGCLLGVTAGYSRSWLDGVLMRLTDVQLAFPYIVLVLLFVSLLGTELWLLVILTALAWVPQVARVTRGVTLEIAHRDFVVAQEILGARTGRIIFREILPNLTSILFVEFALRITWSVLLIAAVSFLGFGVQPPTADWGLMVNENRLGLSLQPWAVAAPIVCIVALTVGVTLIADGLSRVFAGLDRRSG